MRKGVFYLVKLTETISQRGNIQTFRHNAIADRDFVVSSLIPRRVKDSDFVLLLF